MAFVLGLLSARQFQRLLVVAEDVEVVGLHGLLEEAGLELVDEFAFLP